MLLLSLKVHQRYNRPNRNLCNDPDLKRPDYLTFVMSHNAARKSKLNMELIFMFHCPVISNGPSRIAGFFRAISGMINVDMADFTLIFKK